MVVFFFSPTLGICLEINDNNNNDDDTDEDDPMKQNDFIDDDKYIKDI